MELRKLTIAVVTGPQAGEPAVRRKPTRGAAHRGFVVNGTRLLVTFVTLVLAWTACRKPQRSPFVIENISNNSCLSEHPCIACDRNGHVALAWTDKRDGPEDIWLVEKDRGGSWSAPLNLSRSPGESRAVSLYFDRWGVLHAAWSEFTIEGSSGAWVIVYTQRDAQGTWIAPETVRYGVAVKPHVGVDDSGVVHLEFEDMSGDMSSVCYTSRLPAGGWDAVRVISDGDSAMDAAFCVRSDGTVLAAWLDHTTSPIQVSYAAKTPTRPWGAPACAFPVASLAMQPRLASAEGRVCLAFVASGGGGVFVVLTYQGTSGWTGVDTTCECRIPGKASLALAGEGRPMLAWDNGATAQLRIAIRDGLWAQSVVQETCSRGLTSLAYDPAGRVHLTWEAQPHYPDPPDVYYTSADVDSIR